MTKAQEASDAELGWLGGLRSELRERCELAGGLRALALLAAIVLAAGAPGLFGSKLLAGRELVTRPLGSRQTLLAPSGAATAHLAVELDEGGERLRLSHRPGPRDYVGETGTPPPISFSTWEVGIGVTGPTQLVVGQVGERTLTHDHGVPELPLGFYRPGPVQLWVARGGKLISPPRTLSPAGTPSRFALFEQDQHIVVVIESAGLDRVFLLDRSTGIVTGWSARHQWACLLMLVLTAVLLRRHRRRVGTWGVSWRDVVVCAGAGTLFTLWLM